MYKAAFTLGKFMPFHKGHAAMIRFGLTQCETLTVIVCASDKEKIAGSIRQNWIQQEFFREINADKLRVVVYNYLESELAASSEASYSITSKWADAFQKEGYNSVNFDAIVSSELYGVLMARLLRMDHIAFDFDRLQVPISATAIRANLFDNWKYLPPAVREYFAITVVVSGTESTGKTTLAKTLAHKFKGVFVPEVGRDLIPSSDSFTLEDLEKVVYQHFQYVEDAIHYGDSPLIILDTDWHTTRSYAEFTRVGFLGVPYTSKGDLYLYLNNNVPFVQDGTRFSEEKRNELDKSHRDILTRSETPFTEITATDWDARRFQAGAAVLKIIHQRLDEIADILGK